MNVDLAQELLNELGSSLESLEKQHGALLQLLKDKDIVTDDQLAPYLTKAGKASNVRWLAARIRLEHLFSGEKQREEQLAEKQHQAGTAQVPSQNHSGEVKSKNGETKPQSEAEPANAPTESSGAKSVPERDSDQPQGATSDDKKSSPRQEKNDA